MTGGGRGLGLTIVKSLLEQGASVVALDLLPEPSQPEWSSCDSLAKSKKLLLEYKTLDVTNGQQVSTTFQEIFKSNRKHEPVRGLFTAAGIQLVLSALKYTPEQFRKLVDVNLTGSFLCAQAFAKEFIKKNPTPEPTYSKLSTATTQTPGVGEEGLAELGGASIVMTGSMSGSISNFGLECVAYNASKAGVLSLGRTMAMEWGKKGIRVNVSLFIHTFAYFLLNQNR